MGRSPRFVFDISHIAVAVREKRGLWSGRGFSSGLTLRCLYRARQCALPQTVCGEPSPKPSPTQTVPQPREFNALWTVAPVLAAQRAPTNQITPRAPRPRLEPAYRGCRSADGQSCRSRCRRPYGTYAGLPRLPRLSPNPQATDVLQTLACIKRPHTSSPSPPSKERHKMYQISILL